MSLIRRKMTPKLLAANRANALKSTGPRTEQGITNTTQNIVRAFPFPSTTMANMRELGEDPEEYQALCDALSSTLNPQDEFERMLVEDMAQARWRRQRLIRAEASLAASRRRNYEIARDLQRYGRGNPQERLAGLVAIAQFGYSGLPEGVEKCEAMLKLLGQIREGVSERGFDKADAGLFDTAYGKSPAGDNANLRPAYEGCLKAAHSDEYQREPEMREYFLKKVEEEIEVYGKLKELLKARDEETTPAMKDAQLLLDADQLEAIGRYDAGLERQLENKVKLLVAWRTANHATAPDTGTADQPALAAKADTTT